MVEKSRQILPLLYKFRYLVAVVLIAVASFFVLSMQTFATADNSNNQTRVVTIYDESEEKTIITHANSVQDALNDANISVSEYDSISPSADAKLSDSSVIINIHRARPVLVVDGSRQVRVITSAQSDAEIVKAAGITMYAEDQSSLSAVQDILYSGGAGLELTINRAKVVNLELYGQTMTVRTQAKTVDELLKEKNITPGVDDGMNLGANDAITDQMNLRIWRNGIQTVTTTENIAFSTKTVTDLTKKYGSREVQTTGQDGQKTVIYQIEIKDGEEISRQVNSEVVNVEPIEQVEVIGMKSDLGVAPLTASRGAITYQVGSITRKETYYDLPMAVVMGACGAGGFYEVRSDGVKVDRNGFVIVAANLSRYPRCSEVDTSVGRGKVYDTGGFAANNPEQFDIATDWSNRNGQ